jgi:large subunit ribosomal protein L28
MPRQCHFTGKKTTFGGKRTLRGKAKYLGGVGIKTTSRTRRKFKANLQKFRAILDGKPVRLVVSTKALRSGLMSKPLRRQRPAAQPVAAEPVTA